MQSLDALAREAAALTQGIPTIDVSDAARMLQICNACRYCEGFCAVFPAMTRRLEFGHVDVHYLANLCHNCGACLHACQYAPPHEFGVNLPRAMARVRVQTYAENAWPAALAALYRRNGLAMALLLVAALTLFLVLGAASQGNLWQASGAGDFYRVFPHGLMVGLFAPVFAFAVLALTLGVRRSTAAPMQAWPSAEAAGGRRATRHLTLATSMAVMARAANEADDAFTLARRRAHHFVLASRCPCRHMRSHAVPLRAASTGAAAGSACPRCWARPAASR
jgi:citrate/tricarballylate utilization protein